MFAQLRKELNLIRILLILGIIALGWYVVDIAWSILGQFADILLIIILSWLLSFMLEPVVNKISQVTKFSRTSSTAITYVLLAALFALIIFLFIPTVALQIQTLSQIIPKYLQNTPNFLNRFADTIQSTLTNSVLLLPSLAQFFFSAFIVLIFSFYFIVDEERLKKEVYFLIPKKWHTRTHKIQQIIATVFASFLRVQLSFGIITGIITWIILTIFRINFAASTSFLSGIFAVIPLIGPPLSLIPPLFVALMANPSEPTKAIVIFAILLVVQQVIFNVVGPKLLGNALRIHPAIVLFSFLIGIKIAGGIGAIFAIPVLGIITIMLREFSHEFLKRNE